MSTESLNLAAGSLTLAQVNPYIINILVGVFLLISIFMILIVLIQRPQGGGLGGAFGSGGGGGGGGAGQTAFGTKTGDVLTGGTIAIFVLFLTFAIILNFVTRPIKASAEQPTISSPTTTEPIPVDDDAGAPVGDAVDGAIDQAAEVVDDAADAVEGAVDNAAELIDPVVDPAAAPANPDEN